MHFYDDDLFDRGWQMAVLAFPSCHSTTPPPEQNIFGLKQMVQRKLIGVLTSMKPGVLVYFENRQASQDTATGGERGLVLI